MTALSDKLAVVTGASRGIGYHCAKALAGQGTHVIAVARTIGGLEELDDEIKSVGGNATLVPLDLLEHDAIDQLGASIHERWGKLDILIANAGMLGGLSPIEHFEPKTIDKVFMLNVMSNWRLFRSLSPLLRQVEDGRVLVTGTAEQVGKPFWGAYAASQNALKSIVMTWASETTKTGLKINMFDPGPTRTALRAKAMPGEDKQTLADPSEIGICIADLCQQVSFPTGENYSFQDNRFVASNT